MDIDRIHRQMLIKAALHLPRLSDREQRVAFLFYDLFRIVRDQTFDEDGNYNEDLAIQRSNELCVGIALECLRIYPSDWFDWTQRHRPDFDLKRLREEVHKLSEVSAATRPDAF